MVIRLKIISLEIENSIWSHR